MSAFVINLAVRVARGFALCYTGRMKSKQQTPLGYLMGLMDVSLTDLSDHLYVAKTSISKWKTGARTLNPTSQHFAEIVEYFTMLARDTKRHDKMKQLCGRLYPEQSVDNPKELSACIQAFLGGKQLPSVMVQQTLSDEGRLYTAQVDVYHGDTGCLSAVDLMCAYLSDQKPDRLALLNRWDTEELARFVPALEKGWTGRALLDVPPPRALLSNLMAALVHPRMDTRMLPEDMPLMAGAAWYIAGERQMLISSRMPGRPSYAAVYTDPLTVEQYRHGFDDMYDRAETALETVPLRRVGPALYRQTIDTTIDEWMDWLLPQLPYLTMSRPLLMEVLRANDVSGHVWTQVLDGYDILSALRMRLFVPAQFLRRPPDTEPILSLLCGKTIRLTPAEKSRHLLDTAAMLREDRRLTVVPLQKEGAEVWQSVSMFVKRNAYAGYLGLAHSTVRVTRHPALLEQFMQCLEWLAQTETERLRRRGYVAGLLEYAALK